MSANPEWTGTGAEDGRLGFADRAGAPSGLSPTSGSQAKPLIADAGHTPGPWSYRPMEYDDWGIVRAPNEQGQFAGGIICQALDPDARDQLTLARHREAGTDPWEANARLIAAAPELLEALEELAKAADACAPQYEDHPGELQSIVNDAYGLIARTRGQ